MYKLSGHSLTRGTWFLPETQPLNLCGADSTSSITIPRGEPEIGFNDWLLQEDGPEGPIVWRVKGISEQTDTETVTVELEHVVKALGDKSFHGEISTGIIAGVPGASTVTAKKAVQYVLAQQSEWILGDFEFNVSNPYEFNGDALLDAIETVADTLEDSVLEFDMSQFPFKLHVRQLSSTPSCEMRGERNLTTLRRTVNRSGMYTRIYPNGKNNLHIDGDYISRNEELYGRIEKNETDQTKTTKGSLYAWADGLLRKHCEPTVNISISGLELSGETGESLDQLKMNRVCRAPLPEYATTISERIVKKSWRDWIADKQSVTVTLANTSADIATIVKNSAKTSGRAAMGSAQQNYLFEANGEHLYYEVFDDCGHLHSVLEMTEQSLRIGFDNLIESTRSEFQMTSESLRITFENEIASTRSEFQMTSESLRISFENEIASTRSEFQMTSESLRISFENETQSLRSDIQVQAGRIGLVVTGEGTSAAINISAITDGINNDSSVEIIGDRITIGSGSSAKKVKVYIDGKITATEGEITNLKTGTTKATLINSDAFNGDQVTGGVVYATTQLSIGSGSSGGSGTLYFRGEQFYKQALTLGPSNGYIASGSFLGNSNTGMNLNHYHAITATEGTGTDAGKIIITLSDPVATSDTSSHTTNFNIAATQTYINGVAAGKNAVKVTGPTWLSSPSSNPSGNSNTATFTTNAASPSASTPKSLALYLSRGDWSNNKRYVYVSHTNSDAGNRVAKIEVDASTIYTNGWKDCYDTFDSSGTTATKLLSYDEQAVVTVKQKNKDGSVITRLSRTYTAPSDRYNTGYNNGKPWKIELDASMRHAGNWWNFVYYNNDHTSGVLYETDQCTRGLYFPYVSKTGANKITANGTYIAKTEDGVPAYDRVEVDVPTTSHSITVDETIYTAGYSPSSGAISGGNLSKSGLTVGKYMEMVVKCGGVRKAIYHYVVS